MYTLNKNENKPFINNFFNIFILVLVTLIIGLGWSQFTFAEESEIVNPKSKVLYGGWFTLDPYQYQKDENGVEVLTGLDYELMTIFSKEAGNRLSYEHVYWDDLLLQIKEGKKDFATGALYSPERAQYAYYSIPYRYEENSLFVRNDLLKQLNNAKFSLAELLQYLKKNQLKLGVVKGFIYTDPLINNYIQDPNNQDLIVKTKNDYDNINLILDKQIDAFIADRIVGTTMIWRLKAGKHIQEYRLHIQRPIHIIFSKKTVSQEEVNKYNKIISTSFNNEEYQKIVSWYLYPILFLQTEDTLWFRITEIIGTVAFAISGLIIAFKERTTLFGAFILALLPSMGGAIMRDVILGKSPITALQSPVYLSSVLWTVIIGFLIIKLLTHFRRHYEIPREIEKLILKEALVILTITDAIGLAMFTVSGVIVSMTAKVDPLWLWGPFFAFLTGAGGGILRDMLSKNRYIVALEGELYGEIAIIWGLLLSLFILHMTRNTEPEYIQLAVIITIIGVFCTRIWVHFMHIPNAKFK